MSDGITTGQYLAKMEQLQEEGMLTSLATARTEKSLNDSNHLASAAESVNH